MKHFLLVCLLVFSTTTSFAQDDPPKKTDPMSGAVLAPGPAVDKAGTPASDPTGNVLMLVREAVKRLDDIQALHKELSDVKIGYQKEISNIRATNQKESDQKTLETLASIRLVDREDYNKRASDAQIAVSTLAKSAADMAEALRKQVESVAAQVAQQRAIDTAEVNKRLSSLELSSSQGAGKSEGVNATFVALMAIGGLILTGIGLIYRSTTRNGAYARKNGGP